MAVCKNVCQTSVKYHLQIIIGVSFNLLEVPDSRLAAGSLGQCQVSLKITFLAVSVPSDEGYPRFLHTSQVNANTNIFWRKNV